MAFLGNRIVTMLLSLNLFIIDAHGSRSYTVEEAIEKMGFGWFQIRLLALCGVAWVSFSENLDY